MHRVPPVPKHVPKVFGVQNLKEQKVVLKVVLKVVVLIKIPKYIQCIYRVYKGYIQGIYKVFTWFIRDLGMLFG